MELLNQISEKLQKGKAKDVKALVEQAIAENIPVKTILEEGLLSGMGSADIDTSGITCQGSGDNAESVVLTVADGEVTVEFVTE